MVIRIIKLYGTLWNYTDGERTAVIGTKLVTEPFGLNKSHMD